MSLAEIDWLKRSLFDTFSWGRSVGLCLLTGMLVKDVRDVSVAVFKVSLLVGIVAKHHILPEM
jgi:hypothetical protein